MATPDIQESSIKLIGGILAEVALLGGTWIVKPPKQISDHPWHRHTLYLVYAFMTIVFAAQWLAMNDAGAVAKLWGTGLASGCIGVLLFFGAVIPMSAWELDWRAPKATARLFLYAVFLGAVMFGLNSVAIALTLQATTQANSKTGQAITQPNPIYSATVTQKGELEITSETAYDFTTSSGQVNFGCEESRTLTATFPLPSGSLYVPNSARAVVANFSNENSDNPVITEAPQRISASVGIHGLPLQHFPLGLTNCIGGGHGELVLTGRYISHTQETKPTTYVQNSEITAKDPNPRTKAITLQGADNFSRRSIRIDFVEKRNKRPIGALDIDLASGARSAVSPDKRLSAFVDGNLLILEASY